MSLIGRDTEIRELRALLETTACAVVVGPPGIGKTTLAAQLTPRVWVDLEDAHGRDAFVERLARAFDRPVDRQPAILEAAAAAPLLVLDAAEGVEDAVAEWLPELVARTTVLVTSRRRPRLDAPFVELGPLDDDEGARLLRDRVHSVRQAAALDPDELRALSRVLDGVPLALELAATRLRLYAPAQLLHRALQDLQDPARPPRQQLLGAIRSTLAELSDEAREVLALATLLPGPFDTPLLAAAVGRPVDGPLLELLDAALLHPLGEVPPRFRVLAPVREVAAEGLDEQGRQEGLRRLAERILPAAEAEAQAIEEGPYPASARTLSDSVGLLRALLASAEPDIRLRAALVLSARERCTGPMSATVDRDEALPDQGSPALRIRWALAVARAAAHLGLAARARQALTRIEPLLDPRYRAEWLSVWSHLYAVSREPALALEHAERAAAERPDPVLAFRLGGARFAAGDLEGALVAFERATDSPSTFRRAQALYATCAVLRELAAPPERILALATSGAAMAEQAGSTWLAPRFVHVHGIVRADLGDVAEARGILLEGVGMLRALGEHDDALSAWLVARSLELVQGTVPEDVLAPVRPEPGPREAANLDAWRAVVHAALGHHAAAEALAATALATLRDLNDHRVPELTATLAASLGFARPDVARELLDAAPDGRLIALARQALQGAPIAPGPRIEERVLAAVVALQRRGVRVAADGSAFTTPDGAIVDISGRRVLRRVLAELAASDGPLDVPALCARVWSDERLVGDSGTRRVHVAISTLRGLGLRHALVTRTDGYSTAWELVAEVCETLSAL